MIPGAQPKILLNIDNDGNVQMDNHQTELLGLTNQWTLVRERDGLTKESKEVMWVEWNEEGRFKAKHADIAVGR